MRSELMKMTKAELKEVIKECVQVLYERKTYHTAIKEINQLIKEMGYDKQYITTRTTKDELVDRAEAFATITIIG